MQLSAKKLAKLLHGKIDGNADVSVSIISKIEEAKPGSLSFLSNPKYTQYAYTTKASILLVPLSFKPERKIYSTLIRVEDPYKCLALLLSFYDNQKKQKKGIESPVYVNESSTYGANVYIGAFAYIGKNVNIKDNVKIYPHVYIGDYVTIDENSVIYSGVKIYDNCQIGKNVIVHAGAIIGADGFGYAQQKDKTYDKIPQIGHVVLEDNVEIGANTTIDRATMGQTCVKKGSKIDNLVQVAHNVSIGEHNVIAAQCGISGSTKIENYCQIGGQAGLAGHIYIADGAKINAQSGVSKSISKTNQMVTGTPAGSYFPTLRSQALFKQLPHILKRIEYIETQLIAQNVKKDE